MCCVFVVWCENLFYLRERDMHAPATQNRCDIHFGVRSGVTRRCCQPNSQQTHANWRRKRTSPSAASMQWRGRHKQEETRAEHRSTFFFPNQQFFSFVHICKHLCRHPNYTHYIPMYLLRHILYSYIVHSYRESYIPLPYTLYAQCNLRLT